MDKSNGGGGSRRMKKSRLARTTQTFQDQNEPQSRASETQSCRLARVSPCSAGLEKKSLSQKLLHFPSRSSALRHRLTNANTYWNTSIESLKDKSAIVKIDTSALIKKLIALSVDRELDFVDFKSGRSRRKRRMWRKRWAAVIHTESIPGSFWPQVSVTELV